MDPQKLQAYNIPIMRVVEAVRQGNNDVGGRLIESAGAEYMVRGRGYARNTQDISGIVLATSPSGTPVRVQDVGDVSLGPDLRRGHPLRSQDLGRPHDSRVHSAHPSRWCSDTEETRPESAM